jgi:DNA-binding LacI/PurR family transcriptional regulator
VEIVGNKIGYFQAPKELAHENVAVLISASGISPSDKLALHLLKNDVPVLMMGDFHPSKIDFANFNERDAGHSFAVAIAEASVGMSNYLLSFLVPSK